MKGVFSRLLGAMGLATKASTHPFYSEIMEVANNRTASLGARPYERSAWVHAAVNHVVDPLAMVGIKLTTDKRGGREEYEDPGLSAFWERPGKGCAGNLSRVDFVSASATRMLLEGQAFWVLDDTWLDPRSKRKGRIVLAREEKMRPVREGGRGRVLGWDWTTEDGQRIPLLAEQVVMPRFFNPADDVLGLAPWEAARVAAEADYAAGVFAKNLMESNGDRGAYLVAKNGMPTEEQQKQIARSIQEKRMLNRQGVHKLTFLSADLDVKDPMVQSVDANFVAQRVGSRHEIFAAFGVPLSMADIVASYSVGAASDWFRLIHGPCMALGARLSEAMEEVSGALRRGRVALMDEDTSGEDPLYVGFDWDEHPVMQQVRAERLEAADKLWAKGMPMAAINDYLDLGMSEYEGWDVGYLPFSVIAVGGDSEGEEKDERDERDERDDEETEEDAVEELEKLFRQRRAHVCARAAGDSARQKLWQKHWASRQPVIRKYAAGLRREIAKARKETLRALEKAAANGELERRGPEHVTRAAVLDLIFSLADFASGMVAVIRQTGEFGYETAGEMFFEEIEYDDVFESPARAVLDFLDSRENHIKDASEAIWEDVKEELEEGLNEGEGLKKISERVRTTFNVISKSRADTIARTETGAAFGAGRQAAMDQAGITRKEWLTSGLENVRLTHFQAEGQIVGSNETFRVGAADLRYPGDENGPPEEVINCHCVAIAVA